MRMAEYVDLAPGTRSVSGEIQRDGNPEDSGATLFQKTILGIVLILLFMLALVGVFSVIIWTLYVSV